MEFLTSNPIAIGALILVAIGLYKGVKSNSHTIEEDSMATNGTESGKKNGGGGGASNSGGGAA